MLYSFRMAMITLKKERSREGKVKERKGRKRREREGEKEVGRKEGRKKERKVIKMYKIKILFTIGGNVNFYNCNGKWYSGSQKLNTKLVYE